MVQPIAITMLLRVVPTRDDVQGDAATRQVIQGGRRPGGERRGYKAWAVGNEESQTLSRCRSISSHGEAFGCRGGVPDQHRVKARLFVGLGKPAQVLGVHTATNYPRSSSRRPSLRLHTDHAYQFDTLPRIVRQL